MKNNEKGSYPFIITLTGPSMCGKSYVIKKIDEQSENLNKEGIYFVPQKVKKYTTRAYRLEEIRTIKGQYDIDIKSVAKIPKECDLIYQTYGKDYGISIKTLRDVLAHQKCPVIVINDVRVVEEIKNTFPGKVLSLFLFRKIPELEDFIRTSQGRGNTDNNEAKKRYEKAISIYRTYIENISLFDRVILNVKDYSGHTKEIDYTGLQIYNVIKGVINNKIKLGLNQNKNNKGKKFFIISGSAASGKDEIIRAVEKLGKMQAFILSKYTTRPQEPADGDEMICHLVPKACLIDLFTSQYQSEYKKLLLKLRLPNESFINNIKDEFIDNGNETLDEFISVKWEAFRLKSLREILDPLQRFWQEIEHEKKYLIKKMPQYDVEQIINEKYFEENPNYIDIYSIYEKKQVIF